MRRDVSGDTGEEMATLECFYVTYFIWKCWSNKCVRSPVQKLFLVSKLLCHLWFENISTLMWWLKSLCSLGQSRSRNMWMGHYRLQFFFFTLKLKQLLLYSGKESRDDYEHQSVCPPLVANPRCLVDWFCCTCHICSAFIHLHSKQLCK